MPKQFRLDAPDGQAYMLSVPDDATQDQIRAKVAQVKGDLEKKAATTNMASELGLSLPSNYQGETFAGNLASEAGRQFVRGIGGMARTGVEGIAAGAGALGFPETEARLSARAEAMPGQYEEALSAAGLTERHGVGATIGGLIGGGAAYAPFGGPITGGAIAGFTDMDNEGFLDRVISGLTGGAIGLGIKGMGRGAEKILNIKQLDKHIGEIKKEADKLDPLLGDTYRLTSEQVNRLYTWHESLGQQALREGDKLGPIKVDAARDATRAAIPKAGEDAEAKGALETAARALSGDKGRPDTVRARGSGERDSARFDYDPTTGKYTSTSGEPLSDVMANAMAGKPADVKYSDLRLAQDRLDRYIKENKDETGPGMRAVKEAKAAIDARVDEVAPPGTKALERRQKAFYDEYIGKKYDTPEVKDILSAPNETERVLKILDLVRDKKASPEAAKAVADLIGEKGRDAVSRGMMKEALKAALTRPVRPGSSEAIAERMLKEGKIDPVKFLRFFDDKPGFKPFQTQRFQEMRDGFARYIKSGDLEAQAERVLRMTPKTRRITESGFAGIGLIMSIFHGNWAHLAEGMGLAGLEHVGSLILDKAMTDTFGRHLLVAMSRVPEGSPRWMRLVQQFNDRFAAPTAAGLTQQQGAPAARQIPGLGSQGP